MRKLRNTSIKRKKMSAPMTWLSHQGLIKAGGLDYGCGYGLDADIMCLDKFDPNHFNTPPTKKYDQITCIYVLNVILSKKEQKKVLANIKSHLKPKGKAYIAVRRDKEGFSQYQTWVELDLPSMVRNSDFEIYKLGGN